MIEFVLPIVGFFNLVIQHLVIVFVGLLFMVFVGFVI